MAVSFKNRKEVDDFFGTQLCYCHIKAQECSGKLVTDYALASQLAADTGQPPLERPVDNCIHKTTIIVERYNEAWTYNQIQKEWDRWKKIYPSNGGSGGNGGGGGGGSGSGAGAGNQQVPPKKEEPPPPPTPKMVSFGKMFLSFCLPSLTTMAKDQGIDEVQVNFYQMNESCGPISLHSIAEFPIIIDTAEQMFADFCQQRGGESMNVFDFLNWASTTIFADNRSVGYGMRNIIEPKVDPKPEDTPKSDAAPDDKKKPIQDWFDKYGTFKPPVITMTLDTMYEGDNNKIDLLYKLQHRVGAQYNPPPERFSIDDPEKKDKRILRADIYDRSYNPFSKNSKLFKDKDGSYKVFETDVSEDEKRDFMKSYARQYAGPGGSDFSTQTNVGGTQKIVIDGVVVGRSIPKGVNVLREYVGETVPVLTVGGTNSTMIFGAQVQSKTDGLAASINVTGGSYKVKSTISPNALSMAENNLPVRALPVDVTLSTIGCPLASVFQEFFLDFETGTTMDNLYKTKQIQHNFSPGKFETSWTFQYTDGYSVFFGASSINDELQAMGAETKQQNEALEASEQAQVKDYFAEDPASGATNSGGVVTLPEQVIVGEKPK